MSNSYRVPGGWKDCTIGDHIHFEGGTQPPRSTFIFEERPGYIRLVQTRDFKSDRYKTFIPITANHKTFAKTDVMIGRYGPPVFQIYRGLSGAYNVALIKATPKSEELRNDYLYYSLKQDRLFNLIDSLSRRSSGQTGVDMDALKGFPLPLPPVAEQDRIIDVLHTWGRAIEEIELLLAAKHKHHGAIALRFFDPCHVSFHSRPDSWRLFQLGDVFHERTEAGSEDDILLSITMGDGVIDREEVGRKDTSNDDKARYKLILPGDIGYNTMRMWQGVSGLSPLRGIVSPAYTIVTPDNENITARYAAHLFKSRRMVFDFERYSQGLTSDTWNLKFPAFSKIKVFLPPIDLQEKQASLLDEMKEEIAVLQRQRDALARQKRGLMQKLLTGEWRAKVGKEEAAA